MSQSPRKKLTSRSGDLPATRGMLQAVQDNVLTRISGLEHKVDSQFKLVDARFNQVDARFNQVDARFDQVDARFNEVDAKFEQLGAKLDEILLRVTESAINNEDQRSENRVVLEDLNGLYQRQDRVETNVREMHETLRYLAGAKRKQTRQ